MNSRSNIRLIPNVICRRVEDLKSSDTVECDEKVLKRRLSYFELLSLRDANPIMFPPSGLKDANLSERQRIDRDFFLKEGTSDPWPDLAGIRIVSLLRDQGPERSVDTPVSPDVERDREDPGEDVDGVVVLREDGRGSSYAERVPVIGEPDPTDERPPDSNRGPVVSRVPGEDGASEDEREPDVEAPISENSLVLAPPGTGKTHFLIERLCHLISNSETINPADEILVLSFSRAAVAEVRRRVVEKLAKNTGDNLRYVNVRTFDSFATQQLLLDMGHEDLVQRQQHLPGKNSFAQRMALCLGGLRDGTLENAIAGIGKLRCLLVDEVQDLGGIRAELVLEVARQVCDNGGGVCLLGDPTQAIYGDWSRGPGDIGSVEFLRRMKTMLGKSCKEFTFRKSYRYLTPKMVNFAEVAREAMGPYGEWPDAGQLRHLLAGLGSSVTLGEVPALCVTESRVAILARTNTDVWYAKEWCERNGVPTRLHTGAGGRGWPSWMARVFHGFKQDRISEDGFRRRWDKRIGDACEIDAEMALAGPEMEGVRSESAIDLHLLRTRVAQHDPPVSVESGDTVVVSTIHRSKGLEFDSILLVEPGPSNEPAEVRVVYVGATRARRKLRVLQRTKKVFRRTWKLDGGHHRLAPDSLLVAGEDDLDHASLLRVPQSQTTGSLDGVLKTMQDALWTRVQCASQPGALDVRAAVDGQDSGFFMAIPDADTADALRVCALSRDVGKDLAQLARTQPGVSMAGRVATLKVSRLVTVAFDTSDDHATNLLGRAGMALFPVVEGPLRLVE